MLFGGGWWRGDGAVHVQDAVLLRGDVGLRAAGGAGAGARAMARAAVAGVCCAGGCCAAAAAVAGGLAVVATCVRGGEAGGVSASAPRGRAVGLPCSDGASRRFTKLSRRRRLLPELFWSGADSGICVSPSSIPRSMRCPVMACEAEVRRDGRSAEPRRFQG